MGKAKGNEAYDEIKYPPPLLFLLVLADPRWGSVSRVLLACYLYAYTKMHTPVCGANQKGEVPKQEVAS